MRAVPHGKEGKVEVIDRKTITAVIFCGLILKNVHCMAWSVSCIAMWRKRRSCWQQDNHRGRWMRKGRSGLRSKFWDLFWGMADLRLENVDKKILKKRDFLDCTRDWLCYWRPRKRWQSWFDKKGCRAFCTICYKRFPHSLKILSHGPLALTKGTEVFILFVSKGLPVIIVFASLGLGKNKLLPWRIALTFTLFWLITCFSLNI